MTRKAARSCSNRKAIRSRDDHIVVSAGAVDHQQAAVLGSAADDTCMGIVRVKYQITGLCVRPQNIGAIRVLHGGAAAVADDIASACGIVKGPIDE